MTKQYLICPGCGGRLYELEDYEFLNVREDFVGRDVIEFKCHSCDHVGESFVYIDINGEKNE